MSVVDPEHIALVLADAVVLGDGSAAQKWNISRRTVERYRARMREDKGLSALVAEKNASVSRDLAEMRVAFMREAIEVMRGKLPGANVRSIAGAIKIVGELHLAATVVDDERPAEPDSEGASPATYPRGDAGEQSTAPRAARH